MPNQSTRNSLNQQAGRLNGSWSVKHANMLRRLPIFCMLEERLGRSSLKRKTLMVQQRPAPQEAWEFTLEAPRGSMAGRHRLPECPRHRRPPAQPCRKAPLAIPRGSLNRCCNSRSHNRGWHKLPFSHPRRPWAVEQEQECLLILCMSAQERFHHQLEPSAQ